jgi:hypothetical protein
VVSRHYATVNMLHTMEEVLGISKLGVDDSAATRTDLGSAGALKLGRRSAGQSQATAEDCWFGRSRDQRGKDHTARGRVLSLDYCLPAECVVKSRILAVYLNFVQDLLEVGNVGGDLLGLLALLWGFHRAL